jgi:hypothetical protein
MGSSATVTIGAGGTGGTGSTAPDSPTAGGTGGTTTFDPGGTGLTITGTGGAGSGPVGVNSGSVCFSTVGAGGSGTNGQLITTGQRGVAATPYGTPAGGTSFWGSLGGGGRGSYGGPVLGEAGGTGVVFILEF